jgi:hypothetical protein
LRLGAVPGFRREKLDHLDHLAATAEETYDKTARNYLALVQVACARLWLET